MKQCVAHSSLALLSVCLCASHLGRDCVPMHGFGLGNASSSFAPRERKDMGFGAPAAGELAKAGGVGQARPICPSGGNATPK